MYFAVRSMTINCQDQVQMTEKYIIWKPSNRSETRKEAEFYYCNSGEALLFPPLLAFWGNAPSVTLPKQQLHMAESACSADSNRILPRKFKYSVFDGF